MPRKKLLSLMSIYSISHAFVDMTCAILLYALGHPYFEAAQLLFLILLYDFCAFVLQLPIGALLDRFFPTAGTNRNALFAAGGVGLLAVLCLLTAWIRFPLVAAICLTVLIGIANALFHLGAGIDVLCLANKKATLPGIFISTGALGLFLGSNAHRYIEVPLLLLGVCMSVLCALILVVYRRGAKMIRSVPDQKLAGADRHLLRLAAVLLVLVIFYRSFLGYAMKGSGGTFVSGLLATLVVLAGKMLGGFLGDRFGFRKTMLLSLILCALSAFALMLAPAFRYLVLFLFNLSMPITMVSLTNLLGEERGLAFGLNTTALFLGLVIFYLFGSKTTPLLAGLEILLIALVLFIALGIHEREVA